MSDDAKLNVDTSLPGAEERLAELQKRIIAKLTEGYGYELQDDTLSTWIIMIAVRNNSTKQEVSNDLVEFIQENSTDFVNWLWNEVPQVWTPPEQQKKQEEVKKEEKPKIKSVVNVKSNKQSNQEVNKSKNKTKQGYNAVNLMKKALDDTKKDHKEDSKKGKPEASSYVKTQKDGRKVISLKKSGEARVEEEDIVDDNKQKRDKEDTRQSERQGSGSVFDRLNKKGKETHKGCKRRRFKKNYLQLPLVSNCYSYYFPPMQTYTSSIAKSNLDMDLDSVIKNQKQKEYEKTRQEWYPPTNRKRTHPNANKYIKGESEKHDVEEVDIGEKGDPSTGLISLSKKNNNIRSNKRPKTYEDAGEQDTEEPYTGGYKGKKAPYYPMMGYMPPMYDYPPMYMDPYMMYGGYPKPYKKSFKNKTLIVKKEDKDKKSTTEGASVNPETKHDTSTN